MVDSPMVDSSMVDSVDPAALYVDATTTFVELVDRVARTADWTGPGLGVWDLRALVGHTSRALITVADYLDRPAERETIVSAEEYYVRAARQSTDADTVATRGRRAGDDLGERPARAVAELAQLAEAKVRTTAPEMVVAVLGGGMRVDHYLGTRIFELVVHGLDVAAATGQSVEFSSPVLADATSLATRIAVAIGEGPAVLTALTGRRPLPGSFSVVG